MLVNREYSNRRLFLGTVFQVRRKTKTLVFALKWLLLVDGYVLNLAVLPEVIEPPQCFFLRDVGRNSNNVARISLQNAHQTQILLRSLILGCRPLAVLLASPNIPTRRVCYSVTL